MESRAEFQAFPPELTINRAKIFFFQKRFIKNATASKSEDFEAVALIRENTQFNYESVTQTDFQNYLPAQIAQIQLHFLKTETAFGMQLPRKENSVKIRYSLVF